MIIDVLVCRLDGTQTLEKREVPDNWFSSGQEDSTLEQDAGVPGPTADSSL